MARTNIDIDEDLVQQVMRQYGFKTKKEAVNYALGQLVREMTIEEALAMQGTGWDLDLDEIRAPSAHQDWSDPNWRSPWGDEPARSATA